MFHDQHHQHDCPCWVPSHGGQKIPLGALENGRSAANLEPMFVARAYHSDGNDLVPGKLVPSHRVTYIGCNNNCEQGEQNYEVLVSCGHCHYYWQTASNGDVPAGAIEGGRIASTNETLYIARGHPPPEPHHGLHGGKLQPSHQVAEIPYNGTVYAVNHYQVLCKRPM